MNTQAFADGVTRNYNFYGYRLRSEIPLALTGRIGEGAGEPDIHLRLKSFPAELSAPSWSSPFIQIQDDTVLVRFGERLRFLVRDGREIDVHVEPECPTGEIEVFLVSAVAGVVLHLRRELPLHASCVAFHGGAIAIAGIAGAGKSTLAAALEAAGGEFVADDICRVQYDSGAPFATPGPAHLRLWPDAADSLGLDRTSLRRARTGHPKLVIEASNPIGQPVPLSAVIRLRVDPRAEKPYLERLQGPASIMPARDLVYRAGLGVKLGNRTEIFRRLAQLPARAAVYRLTRNDDPSHRAAVSELARQVL